MLEQLFVNAPVEPFALAQRLARRQFVSLFWAEQGRVAYLTCDPIEERSVLDPEPDLQRVASTGSAVPRWVGLLPYECRRSLEREGHGQARSAPHLCEPRWLRYPAVAIIDQDGVRVVGDDRARVRELAERLRSPSEASHVVVETQGESEAPAVHVARIRRALEHIRAGNLYQVSLARRFEFRVQGAPWDVLARLSAQGRAPHAAAFAWGDLDLVSNSPELFLSLDSYGSIITSPIKGTRPRGTSTARDLELMHELDTDPKERAELTMVLDVERNDLSRLAEPGSVELVRAPHIETFATVHHRVATLRATLRPSVTRSEVLARMLPSGSVTGAPKVRAMDLIAELEAERRGFYTGAYGYVAHDGSMHLGMAIRVLSVRGGVGHYFAGGGIVADSDPEREVLETLWKAEALLSLSRVGRSPG